MDTNMKDIETGGSPVEVGIPSRPGDTVAIIDTLKAAPSEHWIEVRLTPASHFSSFPRTTKQREYPDSGVEHNP